MTRSTRLFDIIQILRQAKDPVTARDIAETLEVATRTIYRDIAALQAMRLPIEGEAGVGYVMRSGFDLPPLMFTWDETEAIVVGLALLGRTGDRGLERAAARAASKIAEVLPDGRQSPAALLVSTWNQIPETAIETSALRRFIRDEMELKITYVDQAGQRTTREIKPLVLIYYVHAVVLAAWCELRQAFRHFRVDRIEHCRPTGNGFMGLGEELLAQWEQENDLP